MRRQLLLTACVLAAHVLATACGKAPTAPGAEVRIAIAGAQGHGQTALLAAITKNLAAKGLAEERSLADLDAAGTASVEVSFPSGDRRVTLIDYRDPSALVQDLGSPTSGLDGLVMVVAQAEGVRQQTRDQFAAAGRAGLTSILIFQSKDHLVDDVELKDLEQSEIEQVMVDSGLLAEEDAGVWEGGAFKPGTVVKAFRGSAERALEGDAAALTRIEDLVDAIEALATGVEKPASSDTG